MPLHHSSYFRYPFFNTGVKLLSGANCLVPPHLFPSRSNPWSAPLKRFDSVRGGKWYLEKRGSWKILAVSKSLFLHGLLGLGFLTRISASQRVSDFTIRHPFSGIYYCFLCNSPGLTDCTTAGKIVDVTDKVRVQGSTTATSKEETFR